MDQAYELAVQVTSLSNPEFSPADTDKDLDIVDKTPNDVFYKLIDILKYMSSLSKDRIQVHAINTDREIEPSDVIDLANLLYSQLRQILDVRYIKIQHNTKHRYNITPSHVYARLNQIQAILNKRSQSDFIQP